MIQLKYKYIIFIIPIMLFFSCNVTKNISKNEKLLAKNKIVINNNEKSHNNLGFEDYDIEQIISPKPNSTFLWIPFKLWIYQLYTPEQRLVKEINLNNRCKEKNENKISKINSRIRKLETKRKKYSKEDKKFKKYSIKITRNQHKKGKIESKTCNKKHWSRKLGEPPIFFSIQDEYRNKRKIRVFLKNKGYYQPSVKIQKLEYHNYLQKVLLPVPKFICNNEKLQKLNYYPGKVFFESLCNYSNDNKIIVKYEIETGDVYKIDSIKYNIKNNELKTLVLRNKDKSLLKTGKHLDVKYIEEERRRISTYLRNSGYYTFSKDYIYFSIDTIGKNKFADMTINIDTELGNKKNTIKKHIIKNVYIYPNFKLNEALIKKNTYFKKQDTLIYYTKNNKKYNLIYKDVQRINKRSIVKGLEVASGDLYNLKKIKSSYKFLASLPIIQTANITFNNSLKDSLSTDSFEYIDCEIRLSQDKLQAYEIAAEVTNTSRNLGFAGGLNYTHNNFFRGMEVLDLKFDIEFRRLTRNPDYEFEVSDQWFNSQKYGTEFNINFPRLFVPFFIRKYIKNDNPKSNISGNFNYTKRPDYTWAIAGGTFGYNWKSTNTIKHLFLPFSVDYFYKIENHIPDILSNRNYDDRFILGGSYKFLFNNQYTRKQKDYYLITAYTKIAGNSLYGVNKFLKNNANENGGFSVFGNQFAQFVKAYFDIRYYKKLSGKKDNLVFRFFTGAALPYGNLNVIPFNEQFYSGGSTGIRAWDERSLGPGSYSETNNDQFFYQKGDIKLEGNIEYRKSISNKLETALFVDAGNIWAINNEDKREGALFEINDFYKEIAIGTGFGIRYDFSFFILRIDIGMKLKNPALPVNNRWLSTKDFFSYNNMKFNIGIGYPF